MSKKPVGTISVDPFVHPKAKGDGYYLCTWDVEGDFMASYKKTYSPTFTIPNRDECKWSLFLQESEAGFKDEGNIHFKTKLCLDPESNCQMAVAESFVEVYSANDKRIAPARLLGLLKNFKFVKNAVNTPAIKTTVDMDLIRMDQKMHRPHRLRVLCLIKVIKVTPEDDSLSNDIGSLMTDKRFTDVSIVVNKKKFPAHKVILSARSSVFADMFAKNSPENKDVVNIKGIRKEVVEEMLHYIYTGEVEKLGDLAQDLLPAAVKYGLKGLQNKCEEVLVEGLSSSNAIELLLLADVNNASKLRFEAISLVRKNKTELMKTPNWKKLSKTPALVREISEDHPNPKPASDSGSESEESDDVECEEEEEDNSDYE